ncbi:hypothetical protein M0812_21599 [Anaeramoeba flamelloides]|uniref:Uncharacterized protein n=1 Tax=Anaeramoeba flamelloides TaxID=1746091 RepID=A0AAV7YVF9_9EUKA|nr:hypothetical protein M0812_21599 [Anaeramoeba flamelloides]
MLTFFDKITFTLRCNNEEFCEEFNKIFSTTENKTFLIDQENIGISEEDKSDVFLHLADNSFGFLPEELIEKFGKETQSKLQQEIIDNYYSEVIVGDCVLLPLEDKQFKFFLYAPVSRARESLADTGNIFQSFRASIVAIDKYNFAQLQTEDINEKKNEKDQKKEQEKEKEKNQNCINTIIVTALPGLNKKKDLGSVLVVRQLWEIYKIFIGLPEIKLKQMRRKKENNKEQNKKQKKNQPWKVPFAWSLGSASYQEYMMTTDSPKTKTTKTYWY